MIYLEVRMMIITCLSSSIFYPKAGNFRKIFESTHIVQSKEDCIAMPTGTNAFNMSLFDDFSSATKKLKNRLDSLNN